MFVIPFLKILQGLPAVPRMKPRLLPLAHKRPPDLPQPRPLSSVSSPAILPAAIPALPTLFFCFFGSPTPFPRRSCCLEHAPSTPRVRNSSSFRRQTEGLLLGKSFPEHPTQALTPSLRAHFFPRMAPTTARYYTLIFCLPHLITCSTGQRLHLFYSPTYPQGLVPCQCLINIRWVCEWRMSWRVVSLRATL